jgi:hypothetical protein
MSKFSERMGLLPVQNVLQMEGMTDALRNSLWNVLDAKLWSDREFRSSDVGDRGLGDVVSRMIWTDFFKAAADGRPHHGYDIVKRIRTWYFEAQWNEVYDFVEFMLELLDDKQLNGAINTMLERELAGFRYIGGCFVPVTAEEEVQALVEATAVGPFSGVIAHLRSATEHLSRKQDPDYRNSIKESISAIESMAREVSGNDKATLGEALAAMEREGKFHPALRKSLGALYGYASDEGGIRHAMLEEPNLTVADAKFMLVACAAFVNYMKAKI